MKTTTTTISIAIDNDFNVGWLWCVLGMPMPTDANMYFREGYDTALETPSLHSVRYVMSNYVTSERVIVSRRPTPPPQPDNP